MGLNESLRNLPTPSEPTTCIRCIITRMLLLLIIFICIRFLLVLSLDLCHLLAHRVHRHRCVHQRILLLIPVLLTLSGSIEIFSKSRSLDHIFGCIPSLKIKDLIFSNILPIKKIFAFPWLHPVVHHIVQKLPFHCLKDLSFLALSLLVLRILPHC